jgi:hypothetical protein
MQQTNGQSIDQRTLRTLGQLAICPSNSNAVYLKSPGHVRAIVDRDTLSDIHDTLSDITTCLPVYIASVHLTEISKSNHYRTVTEAEVQQTNGQSIDQRTLRTLGQLAICPSNSNAVYLKFPGHVRAIVDRDSLSDIHDTLSDITTCLPVYIASVHLTEISKSNQYRTVTEAEVQQTNNGQSIDQRTLRTLGQLAICPSNSNAVYLKFPGHVTHIHNTFTNTTKK